MNKIIVVVEFCNDLNNQAASEDAKFLFKTLRMRNLNNMNDLYNAYDLCNASNVWVSPKKMYFGQLFKRLHREKQIYRHNCTSNKWGHCWAFWKNFILFIYLRIYLFVYLFTYSLFKVDLQKPINVNNNTAHISGHKLPNEISNNENT